MKGCTSPLEPTGVRIKCARLVGYLLLYLGVLLAVLIAINVVIVRSIRAERRRDDQQRSRSGR